MQISFEAARINAGYTQEEAGRLFGVHYQTIANWEKDNGKMPFNMIKKIPQVYGVPMTAIYFGNKNEFIRSLRSGKFVKS